MSFHKLEPLRAAYRRRPKEIDKYYSAAHIFADGDFKGFFEFVIMEDLDYYEVPPEKVAKELEIWFGTYLDAHNLDEIAVVIDCEFIEICDGKTFVKVIERLYDTDIQELYKTKLKKAKWR